ncbi:hypothetical protein V8B97DRAFT_1290865 [Scleroderma yunnanense]
MAIVQSIEHPQLLIPTVSSFPRSRDSFASVGRGGSGNIRRSSIGSKPATLDSVSLREKESPSTSRFVSVGRGGSGNLQPPSPDLADHPLTAAILSEHRNNQLRYEEQVRKYHAESTVWVRPRWLAESLSLLSMLQCSSGRGGSGNINNSRRSKSRPPSTGSKSRKASSDTEHTIIDALHLIRPKGFGKLKLSSPSEDNSRRPVEEPPHSPTSPHDAPEKRTKRKRSFLKPWNRLSHPQPPPLPDHISVSSAPVEHHDVVLDVSSENSDFLQVDPRRNSRGGASVISSHSSGSGSVLSSQLSTQSLPVLPEDREYVSFLDF